MAAQYQFVMRSGPTVGKIYPLDAQEITIEPQVDFVLRSRTRRPFRSRRNSGHNSTRVTCNDFCCGGGNSRCFRCGRASHGYCRTDRLVPRNRRGRKLLRAKRIVGRWVQRLGPKVQFDTQLPPRVVARCFTPGFCIRPKAKYNDCRMERRRHEQCSRER